MQKAIALHAMRSWRNLRCLKHMNGAHSRRIACLLQELQRNGTLPADGRAIIIGRYECGFCPRHDLCADCFSGLHGGRARRDDAAIPLNSIHLALHVCRTQSVMPALLRHLSSSRSQRDRVMLSELATRKPWAQSKLGLSFLYRSFVAIQNIMLTPRLLCVGCPMSPKWALACT